MLTARIVEFPGIRLAGISACLSFDADRTPELWKRFMAEIYLPHRSSFAAERYSVAVYPAGFFDAFNPGLPFEKWAAAPCSCLASPGIAPEWLEIPRGTYAVFDYCGMAAAAVPFFTAIFSEWLPRSGFRLDLRPHFEILPPEYRPDDPQAREVVYIPVEPVS